MNTYAVEYHYSDDSAALDEHRPAHREYLRGLLPDPLLVAGAFPGAERPGGLLILRSDDVEAIERALDPDPFNVQGLIVKRTIRLWNPGIGTL